MARRVNSELLLVGSLPADSAESALRAAAAFYDGLVFALPDGETGPRSAWVGYERERLTFGRNADVVVVHEMGRRPGSHGARLRNPGVRRPPGRHRTCAGIPGRGSMTRSLGTRCSARCAPTA